MASSRLIRIAITPPDIFAEETAYILTILDAGWDFVHLRHPGASITDMRRIIESIPQRYHNRLRLHGHFELVNEFNLGGLHLNRRCLNAPGLYSGSLSRSCHTIGELSDIGRYDYVTLSPVCDSISKPGYTSVFTDEELASIPHDKIIALGGITPERLEYVTKYPFAGIAVLGYLFNAPDIPRLKERLAAFE